MDIYNSENENKAVDSYSKPIKVFEETKSIGQKENMPDLDLILN